MKRGQIESGELIMIILIVMIFLILGIVAYSNFKERAFVEKLEDTTSLDAIDLAQEALGMMEISCGYTTEVGTECVDMYRVEALSGMIRDAMPVNNPDEYDREVYNYYKDKFGSALINISVVYPVKKSWIIYNSTPEDANTQIPLRVPVTIYNPVNKTDYFGFIEVVKYR